ncbi:MAG: hypothetical protein HY332_08615 [Chloroflexi bacterium]|nr:hypothetical protein [Chloroflexota bacterium]
MLRNFRSWFLAGALVVCAILFIGLVHDFALANPESGWFTSQPIIPVALLVIGYLFMILQGFAARGEGE